MKAEHLYTAISIAILGGLLYLFYKVISPFLIIIAWAVVLSITFYPLYRTFLKFKVRPWLSSLVTLLIILIIILGPFTYIASVLVDEIAATYKTIENKDFEIIAKMQQNPVFLKLLEKISSFTEERGIDFNEAAIKSLKGLGIYIGEHFSQLFKNIIVFGISFIIMCMTIFYFLKDGETLASYIKSRLPFTDEQKELFETRAKEMVIAAIYGGIAVGVVQGILGGLAFFVLGLPSPVFWGIAMAFSSLIPFLGPFFIWGPAVAILILIGSYTKGIVLLFFGTFAISMVDNILKPLIIGGRTKLHMLLIFFSVLGGIKFFGLVGFILGPLIVALCLSLLEIYTLKPSDKGT